MAALAPKRGDTRLVRKAEQMPLGALMSCRVPHKARVRVTNLP